MRMKSSVDRKINPDLPSRQIEEINTYRILFTLGVVCVLLLSACSQTEPQSGEPSITTVPVLLATEALPSPTVTESIPAEQRAAVLPDAQQDLTALSGLTRYTIQVSLDDSLRLFQGKALVELTNTEDQALPEVYFRLLPNGGMSYGDGSLTVTEARVQGQSVQTDLSVGDTVIKVPLSTALAPGERVVIGLDFRGAVPLDFGGEGSPYAYGIFNYTQGVLALSGWYPILAVYDQAGWHLDPVSPIGDSVFSDMAFYDVTIDVPASLVLAASGVETGRQSSGERTTRSFASGLVRDFFMVGSADYEVVSETHNGTLVNSYFLPGYASAAEQALDVGVRSLRVYNDRFGLYPYVELDFVQAPMRYALGVEYPGIVMIGASLYDKPQDPSFTVTLAHEAAHQWWYNLVGNDVFREPWLDEGLTTYTSGVFLQDAYGQDAYQGLVEYWSQRYDRLVQDGNDDQVVQSLEHFEKLGNPSVYGGVVYTKCALFFKALRDAVGDEVFFNVLQGYFSEQKYQIATGEDLLASFERVAGKDLDALYQEWLFTP